MQPKFKSFSEALAAKPALKAANGNNPTKKQRTPRYRGTLPALRWLFDQDADLANAVAAALPKSPSQFEGATEITTSGQEIRPTIGELLKAASDAFRVYVRDGVRNVGSGLRIVRRDEDEWVHLGKLRFYKGRLQQWGATRKGKALKPVDRTALGGDRTVSSRNVHRYLDAKPTIPSPLHAVPYQRPFSGEQALPPMLDPLDGVECNRAILAEAYAKTPHAEITRCPTVIAKGAEFLGGISKPKGTSSSGVVGVWEGPEPRKGEVGEVLEEVAARGTLRSIGERLGYSGDYADRAGKRALLEAARVLLAANDNVQKKVAA